MLQPVYFLSLLNIHETEDVLFFSMDKIQIFVPQGIRPKYDATLTSWVLATVCFTLLQDPYTLKSKQKFHKKWYMK